jgi:hypothetical protein
MAVTQFHSSQCQKRPSALRLRGNRNVDVVTCDHTTVRDDEALNVVSASEVGPLIAPVAVAVGTDALPASEVSPFGFIAAIEHLPLDGVGLWDCAFGDREVEGSSAAKAAAAS